MHIHTTPHTVPVQPSIEQLISRQKDFSNAVIQKAVLSRSECLATCNEPMTRDDHVIKSDEQMTTSDEQVTRGEHLPKDKLAFWNKWEKGCNSTAKKDPAVHPGRRNRRLRKVLKRMIRKSAHVTKASCHRRTPYGVRVIGLSRLKCTQNSKRGLVCLQ